MTKESGGQSTGPAAPPRKARDPYLDNARAILITLVVIGHFLDNISSYSGGAIDTWIYAFHMPAFVAISGYLSRSYRNEPRQLRRILTALLVPFLIFQLIQAVLRVVVRGDDFGLHLWTPSWTLWFLLALFIWRVLTPLLRALRYPLVFAAAISVIAPLEAQLDQTLTWGRVLSFLPFFVLGLVTRPEHLLALRRFRFKYLGGLVLAAGLALSFGIHEEFRISVFHMSTSYAEHDVGNLQGALVRIAVLIVATVATVALLLVTPQRRYWWTDIGKNSLTVYLLHAAIFYPLRESAFMQGIDGPLGTVLVILAAIALTLILSREWVVRWTSWLTNPPIGHWLIADPRTGPAMTPRSDPSAGERTR